MAGFFFDIRTFFHSRHSGRYLALLLRELALQEPETVSAILKLSTTERRALRRGELQVVREMSFLTNQGKRRFADLAVLKGGQPLVLVEIKEDDILSPHNSAQLDDYLAYLSSNEGTRFFYVSRYSPPTPVQLKLTDARKHGYSV